MGEVFPRMMHSQLRPEQRLVLLCARTRMSEGQQEQVLDLLAGDIDEVRLLNLCVHHGVAELVGRNLQRAHPRTDELTRRFRLLSGYYAATLARNRAVLDELPAILRALDERHVQAVPLKGVVLVPEVYRDFGLRFLGDVDFLIRTSARPAASAALRSIGFETGLYDRAVRRVVPVPRHQQILWTMHVGNLLPHVKLLADPAAEQIEVDFSYDADLEKNYRTADGLLDAARPGELLGESTMLLSPCDFLIHLAIHLHKEATNVYWIERYKHLNLIKFCDLREHVFAHRKDLDWRQVADRVRQLGVERALFYSFYYLHYLYGDGFARELLEELGVTDTTYLSQYGEHDYGAPAVWRRSFDERFFEPRASAETSGPSKLRLVQETLTRKAAMQPDVLS